VSVRSCEPRDQVILTLDIDWAPDFVIDALAAELVARRVCATWFVTHSSAAIERLRCCPELFELGIHPNFLPGSSHGGTPHEVLAHCMALVPEARAMRTHALVQSTPLLTQIMRTTPIAIDVSVFLPHVPFLRPFSFFMDGNVLWRVPYLWEDDCEMDRPSPCWHLRHMLRWGGCKVFDFHPIHVYLNSSDMRNYRGLCAHVPRLYEATADDVMPYVRAGVGTRTMFDDVLEYLVTQGGGARISDFVAMVCDEEA
jgi:hypothetical protein